MPAGRQVNQMSFQIFSVDIRSIYLTYLPLGLNKRWNWHLSFVLPKVTGTNEAGCQGFIGPLPSAFLDKFILIPIFTGRRNLLHVLKRNQCYHSECF